MSLLNKATGKDSVQIMALNVFTCILIVKYNAFAVCVCVCVSVCVSVCLLSGRNP